MFSPTTGRVASMTGRDFSVSISLPLGLVAPVVPLSPCPARRSGTHPIPDRPFHDHCQGPSMVVESGPTRQRGRVHSEEAPMAEVHGTCDDRFAGVRDALATQLDGEELGASIAVDVDGETVLDLWGGYRDEARTTP